MCIECIESVVQFENGNFLHVRTDGGYIDYTAVTEDSVEIDGGQYDCESEQFSILEEVVEAVLDFENWSWGTYVKTNLTIDDIN